MKRAIYLLLAVTVLLSMAFSFCACDNGNNDYYTVSYSLFEKTYTIGDTPSVRVVLYENNNTETVIENPEEWLEQNYSKVLWAMPEDAVNDSSKSLLNIANPVIPTSLDNMLELMEKDFKAYAGYEQLCGATVTARVVGDMEVIDGYKFVNGILTYKLTDGRQFSYDIRVENACGNDDKLEVFNHAQFTTDEATSSSGTLYVSADKSGKVVYASFSVYDPINSIHSSTISTPTVWNIDGKSYTITIELPIVISTIYS